MLDEDLWKLQYLMSAYVNQKDSKRPWKKSGEKSQSTHIYERPHNIDVMEVYNIHVLYWLYTYWKYIFQFMERIYMQPSHSTEL